MSKWQSKLDLRDLWEAHDKGEKTMQEIAKEIAIRIRKNKFYHRYEDTLEEIALNFESCDDDVDEFDNILNDLYDWADTPLDNNFIPKKLCWIATRF